MESVIEPSDDEEELINSLVKFYETEERTDVYIAFQKQSFRKNPGIMTIDEKIRDENLKSHINRETAKIKLSGKIDKYKYLTGEEMLPSYQSRMIKHGEFTYPPFKKAI